MNRRRRQAAFSGLVAAFLVAATGLISLLTNGSLREPQGADAPAYIRAAETLLATGSLVLPPPDTSRRRPQERLDSPFGSPYALGADGLLRPKHPWLFTLVLTPGIAVGSVPGARLTALLLAAALAALVASRAARDFGALPSLAATLAVLLLMPAGRNVLWAVNIDTALALASVAALRWSADGSPLRAGVAAAAALTLRPSALILLAPAPFLLARHGRPALLRATATLVPFLAASAAVNHALWGAPWRNGYERVVVFGESGFSLARVSASFGGSVLEGLGLLLGVVHGGLLAAAPVVLLAAAGFLLPAARTPFWVCTFASTLAAYLSLAPYAFLREAEGTLYRFALPLLAASVGPVAALLSEAGRFRLGRRKGAEEEPHPPRGPSGEGPTTC